FRDASRAPATRQDPRAKGKPHAPRDPNAIAISAHPATPQGKRAEPLFIRDPRRRAKLAS
ncbi:MAG: hypothetical protein WB997_13980, partial [Candidatus Acidiferrales bacterium]